MIIKQITDNNIFLEICDKLEEVKDCELKKSTLYGYMVSGIYNQKVFTFINYDKDKMNGCLVLSLAEINSDLILNIIFVWLNPKYPNLWKEYMKFIETKAKEYNAKKIIVITKRDFKAIERKYGKYGYQKKYSIIMKEMN